MPYIKREDRLKFKEVLNKLLNLLEADMDNVAGNLNYIFSYLIRRMGANTELKYKKINEFIGALECIKLEYYRRIVAEYEDKKIKENTDIL